MPARGASLPVGGCGPGGAQSYDGRLYREAMARNTSPQDYNRDFDRRGGQQEPQEWDDADWDPDQEAAAGHRARRLLSRSSSGFHRFGDGFGALRRWLGGGRWLKRLAIVVGALAVIFVGCFGALWWRLGAGPINLDIATPWLAAAIEDNIGHGNTVEVGGTQIERAGRVRIAVRIRDIIVRDHDHVIVATAPKAEVKLSGAGLLMGHLRAESLNLVDAELAIRIAPDGTVTVSAGDTAKPLATGVASKKDAGLPPTFPRNGVPPPPFATAPAGQDSSQVASQAAPPATAQSGILQGLDWLDSLSMTGLDGQNLNEIGLKNGNLIVDDQQRGSKWTFENITLSLRRPSRGGVALSLGEEGARPWSLRATIGPAENGVRSVDIRADKVSTANILLALRVKDLTYTADLPLTGELKGELGRDGVPTFFRGKIAIGSGNIIDTDTPDYPMAIDSAEINIEWDANRRVLVAPFKILSGANRLTLLAHLEPPNGTVNDWQLGFSGGSILLGGIDNEPPLVFNRIAIGFRFDTDHKRMLLTQADISNGEIGVAGTGAIDYSGEPRLTLGFAGTPMSASALKRMWPTLVVPELREWVIERIERGTLQRIEIGVNSPTRNLPRKGPPIPDDGLSVNIVASGVAVRPVDGMPVVHDADLRARVTGRTATVNIGQGIADTPAGRKVTISDFVFEVPDMAPKPSPSRTRFRVDGPVPAAAEMLSNDRLSDLSSTVVDPNTSKGTFTANIQLGLPVKGELTKADTTYAVTADLNGFAADKLVMNQKLEANNLKIVANNQGYQVKGDVKINGQAASLDYRKPTEGDVDVRLQATLDDASRARLGFDLSPAVSGSLPIKLSGKIASGPDQTTKLGVEADLTSVKLDNILPGWVKLPGKSGKASFKVVPTAQSTRLEDIVIEGGGASIKGSLEVDPSGDLMNANFPVYAPSDGDKTTLKVERGQDGVVRGTMRGDVFDGRGFLKSAISGNSKDDGKNKMKNVDFDIDVKLGAVAGFNGEAMRSVDAKMSRRNGTVKAFTLNGKIGRDTPVAADLRGGRAQGNREVIYLQTNDAGALLRFTDTYTKAVGGQMVVAMEPPTSEPNTSREGLINVRDFTVKGEAQLERVAAGAPNGTGNGVSFSALRAEFTRQNGALTIRDGVVKGPMIGATIEGSIDYPGNQVCMSGTFVPMYGVNNIFGQIPLFGIFLGGGNNEGLIGVTYEVVGTPAAPVMRVNPISAMAPGLFRKIFEFNTGKQNSPFDEFPSQSNDGSTGSTRQLSSGCNLARR
ncbi:AsmA-like C-terminal region-containing protein [Bradyrhizobium sp. CCGB20]|uniref:AsmA-like C-terminal region-containing protein n=1 Tax=Bradyrhizobium sp. CCGB20 TaxID=2949633 RepID=UPI0020B2E5A8|nr:AsmA-like C-terminal region-containing protein [Bradyrhizobium sp. CCGB20]MCP3399634.1 AsmA-like C-terminal region-containing protein [Bradyrhizobium sp. CCGB20]